MARRLRPPLAAALIAVAFAAGAARAEMVVVATTAPNVEPGRVVAAGERLDLPADASVTLLGADGRSLTLRGPGGVVPADDAGPERRSVLDALAALFGGGAERTVLAAVRGTDACARAAGRSDVERVVDLVKRGCGDAARARLDGLVAAVAPPAVRLTTDVGAEPVYRLGDRLVLRAQPNFDAYLYCYYRQADGRVLPIFPIGDPASARVPGNRPYQLPLDLRFDRPVGTEAVSCFATERDLSGELGPPLVGRPFEPLPDDMALRLPALFQRLGGARLAEARLVITVVP